MMEEYPLGTIQALQKEIDELEAENQQLKKTIEELEKDSEILHALEAGGVDNWEWYAESLKEVWEKHEQ